MIYDVKPIKCVFNMRMKSRVIVMVMYARALHIVIIAFKHVF